MKKSNPTRRNSTAAFTLIELLVVIAIIGVLAALIFPALRAAKISATRGKVRTELKQIESAIDAYQSKYNFYPPDRPSTTNDIRVIENWHALNLLFYELLGTTQKGTAFETLDGREQIQTASIPSAFGAGVAGFVNCTKPGDADDSKAAQRFLSGLRSDQIGIVTLAGVRCGILVCPVPWPANLGEVIPGAPELNPWRYNSSSPTHNPKSYDLWVDIAVAGKTNRISNWNKDYEIVN